jgi:chaperone required for assembly of F1-ATPase
VKPDFATASAEAADGGWLVAVAGKPLRTPAGNPLVAPTRALADAIAAEWRAKAGLAPGKAKAAAMPLTRLAATAIDRVATHRQAVIDEITGYGQSDLLCHRAAQPPELAARQQAVWQPWLDWLERRFAVRLRPTPGVMPQGQAAAALASLRAVVADRDDFALIALHALTTACGSVTLALALADGALDTAGVHAASQLDELHQEARWGADPEAQARRQAIAGDLAATARFLALSRA